MTTAWVTNNRTRHAQSEWKKWSLGVTETNIIKIYGFKQKKMLKSKHINEQRIREKKVKPGGGFVFVFSFQFLLAFECVIVFFLFLNSFKSYEWTWDFCHCNNVCGRKDNNRKMCLESKLFHYICIETHVRILFATVCNRIRFERDRYREREHYVHHYKPLFSSANTDNSNETSVKRMSKQLLYAVLYAHIWIFMCNWLHFHWHQYIQ